jgi:diguanylate cyclase (GGDEF)-like protein
MATTAGLRILLVEKDSAAAERLTATLHEIFPDSLTVEPVRWCGDALKLMQDEPCSAVLISLASARDVDGVVALKSAAPDVPVIAIIATDDEAFALNVLKAGAQDSLYASQLGPQLLSRSIRYTIERAHAQEQIAYLAQYDAVTALPNRVLFKDRLEHALTHAQRKGARVAVVSMDLDYFKSVNDLLGHEVADRLLCDIAERIKGQIRRGDTLARMGGDEFMIILEDIRDFSDAAHVAQKILDAMSRAFVIQGEEMFITTSIGIASFPACGIESTQLIKNADAALYAAKRGGRGCYRFYDPTMNEYAEERLKTLTRLRHAIARDEFELHYQPLIDARSQKVTGFEALLRWNDAKRGMVSPGEFVGLLEDTGLIIEVGHWVLRTACAQQRKWLDDGFGAFKMAVNVSARQFRQRDFVGSVALVLQDTGMDPHFLQLEITESLLIDNLTAAAAKLRALHTLGVRFSIDDFGTGYSSLNYLKRFPLHALKVDRTFLEHIAEGKDDDAIVNAIISLGHSLSMKVVAEGVETEAQLKFLQDSGCDGLQGYLFATPMRAGDVESWLKERVDRGTRGATVLKRDAAVG